jgi:hypothetical protein
MWFANDCSGGLSGHCKNGKLGGIFISLLVLGGNWCATMLHWCALFLFDAFMYAISRGLDCAGIAKAFVCLGDAAWIWIPRSRQWS